MQIYEDLELVSSTADFNLNLVPLKQDIFLSCFQLDAQLSGIGKNASYWLRQKDKYIDLSGNNGNDNSKIDPIRGSVRQTR